MKKIVILINLILLITGCSHHVKSDSQQDIEKISARVLVYIPENFLHYQSDHAAVIKSLSFKFNEPVTQFLPALFNDTFGSADFSYTPADLNDKYDFLAVPKFEKVTFDSDRSFGHELRVTISTSFTSANQPTPIEVKGTGLSEDMYGGKTIYEQELANEAFVDALKDLQKNIQNKRSEFENTGQ
ncbi:MAG: hypothetical protein HF978_15025 [Desulfobacteraceae bacterium]|nr:hypothetical protein [Desulfobacteraceae bacterium]MBC2756853.1 hypothetical protein [Desulfobacteraceae bacterium]